MPASDCTTSGVVVRSAWEAMLFAERLGGWPIVLRREGTGAHTVGSPAEAGALLEAHGEDTWLAEASPTTWRCPRPVAVR